MKSKPSQKKLIASYEDEVDEWKARNLILNPQSEIQKSFNALRLKQIKLVEKAREKDPVTARKLEQMFDLG